MSRNARQVPSTIRNGTWILEPDCLGSNPSSAAEDPDDLGKSYSTFPCLSVPICDMEMLVMIPNPQHCCEGAVR